MMTCKLWTPVRGGSQHPLPPYYSFLPTDLTVTVCDSTPSSLGYCRRDKLNCRSKKDLRACRRGQSCQFVDKRAWLNLLATCSWSGDHRAAAEWQSLLIVPWPRGTGGGLTRQVLESNKIKSRKRKELGCERTYASLASPIKGTLWRLAVWSVWKCAIFSVPDLCSARISVAWEMWIKETAHHVMDICQA